MKFELSLCITHYYIMAKKKRFIFEMFFDESFDFNEQTPLCPRFASNIYIAIIFRIVTAFASWREKLKFNATFIKSPVLADRFINNRGILQRSDIREFNFAISHRVWRIWMISFRDKDPRVRVAFTWIAAGSSRDSARFPHSRDSFLLHPSTRSISRFQTVDFPFPCPSHDWLAPRPTFFQPPPPANHRCVSRFTFTLID